VLKLGYNSLAYATRVLLSTLKGANRKLVEEFLYALGFPENHKRFTLEHPWKQCNQPAKQQKLECIFKSVDFLLGGNVLPVELAKNVASMLTYRDHARGLLRCEDAAKSNNTYYNKQGGYVSMQVIEWILAKLTPFRLVRIPPSAHRALILEGNIKCGRYMITGWPKNTDIDRINKKRNNTAKSLAKVQRKKQNTE
jgi:hypothetical protein